MIAASRRGRRCPREQRACASMICRRSRRPSGGRPAALREAVALHLGGERQISFCSASGDAAQVTGHAVVSELWLQAFSASPNLQMKSSISGSTTLQRRAIRMVSGAARSRSDRRRARVRPRRRRSAAPERCRSAFQPRVCLRPPAVPETPRAARRRGGSRSRAVLRPRRRRALDRRQWLADGLPPKFELCIPGANRSLARPNVIRPPKGKPAPTALGEGHRVRAAPVRTDPGQLEGEPLPRAPRPVCTSSRISSASSGA